MPASAIRITGLDGIPEVRKGDQLTKLILDALQRRMDRPGSAGPAAPALVEAGVIFVVAQKIVSKSEGRMVELSGIKPSARALSWATEYNRDPRVVEIVLSEARRVVRMDRGVLIVETHHGFICANGGVDTSNAPKGSAILLPLDPDKSARELHADLYSALGVQLGVIISDTFGRPWRQGLTNVALGLAGISPFVDYRGQADSYGRPLHATVLAAADEMAAAAELVMGKTSGVPVAIIEGFQMEQRQGSGKELIRPPGEDLFR